MGKTIDIVAEYEAGNETLVQNQDIQNKKSTLGRKPASNINYISFVVNETEKNQKAEETIKCEFCNSKDIVDYHLLDAISTKINSRKKRKERIIKRILPFIKDEEVSYMEKAEINTCLRVDKKKVLEVCIFFPLKKIQFIKMQ